MDHANTSNPRASVVVPAHNESRSITRTLGTLLRDSDPGEFDVIVVCNGCTDDTASVARDFRSDVRVIELPDPSKFAAMRHGDGVARTFPRVYLDADVELDTESLRILTAAATSQSVRAVGPRRILPRDRCSTPVSWYYDIWERLPQVRTGLFGRGVIALSADAAARVDRLPAALSDDLIISECFDDGERVVIPDATVIVRPPRTLRDLINRRVRVARGVAQADRLRLSTPQSHTRPRDLALVVRGEPRMALRMPVFLAVTAIARFRSRRAVRAGDFSGWERDDSSRS